MSFFERFNELAKIENLSVNAIAKELGLSSGSITAWKNGTEPSIKAVVAIAKRLNVSIDYLLCKTDNPTPNEKDSPRELSDDDLKFGLFGKSDITDAKFDEVKRFAKWVMEREKDDGNGKAT